MIERGSVVSFDSGSYTAVVVVGGASIRRLTGVKVSRAIGASEMVSGRDVLVWLPSWPANLAVVVAVWS